MPRPDRPLTRGQCACGRGINTARNKDDRCGQCRKRDASRAPAYESRVCIDCLGDYLYPAYGGTMRCNTCAWGGGVYKYKLECEWCEKVFEGNNGRMTVRAYRRHARDEHDRHLPRMGGFQT